MNTLKETPGEVLWTNLESCGDKYGWIDTELFMAKLLSPWNFPQVKAFSEVGGIRRTIILLKNYQLLWLLLDCVNLFSRLKCLHCMKWNFSPLFYSRKLKSKLYRFIIFEFKLWSGAQNNFSILPKLAKNAIFVFRGLELVTS